MKAKESWIQAFNGQQVFPLAPKPIDFVIENVAHALALKCRFNGHCKQFYSVAQHAVIVSQYVDPQNALWGLMHELDEVFLPDVPSPIKPFLPNWNEIAGKQVIAGAQTYHLTLPMPKQVHEIDLRALHSEIDILLLNTGRDWSKILPPKLPCQIIPISWQEAEQLFLSRYNEITEEKN